MLGSYCKTKSDIHDLNPILKIVNMLLFVIAIMITNNIYLIGVLIIFLTFLILLTNISTIKYLKVILSLKVLIIFIIVINLIFKVNQINTFITILRLISIVIYSNVLIYTTTPTNITKALNNLLKPLRKIGIKVSVISLMISLSLRFIPSLLEQGRKIVNNLTLRNITDKKYMIKSLVFPLFIITLKKADKIADIMSLKNYDINKEYRYKFKCQYLDYLLTFIHVILLVVVIGDVIK